MAEYYQLTQDNEEIGRNGEIVVSFCAFLVC